MLLHRMPPAVLGSNCYVIVPAGKQGALVVDPGAGAASGVVEFPTDTLITAGIVPL